MSQPCPLFPAQGPSWPWHRAGDTSGGSQQRASPAQSQAGIRPGTSLGIRLTLQIGVAGDEGWSFLAQEMFPAPFTVLGAGLPGTEMVSGEGRFSSRDVRLCTKLVIPSCLPHSYQNAVCPLAALPVPPGHCSHRDPWGCQLLPLFLELRFALQTSPE